MGENGGTGVEREWKGGEGRVVERKDRVRRGKGGDRECGKGWRREEGKG